MMTSSSPLSIASVSINNHHHRIVPLISNNSIFVSSLTLSNGVRGRRRGFISCEVALKSDSAAAAAASISTATEDEELSQQKIGARVRVKVPLKVYHVPKVPEIDLTGMEGKLKQYVAIWKGKRISSTLPFKVEFITDIEGRGPVKFFAHLKEDEFDYIEDKA